MMPPMKKPPSALMHTLEARVRAALAGLLVAALLAAASAAQSPQTTAQPPSPIPSTHLRTKWASDVTPDHVLPEYPRPQMARKAWTNLNGTWDYVIADANAPRPESFPGRVLVPFPIESQLSGAGVWVPPQQRLWYHRTFTVPRLPDGQRLLLNFGAVDWEAEVVVDGRGVGQHR